MRALVVLLLLSVSTPAFAIRPPLRTLCELHPSVFPAEGATNVPLNAHAWVTAGTLGDYRLRDGTHERRLTAIVHDPFRIIELPLGELEANTIYSLVYGDRVLSTFTTGTQLDETPPAAPHFIGARAFEGTRGGLIGRIELLLVSSHSAAMMRLTVRTVTGVRTITAPEATLRKLRLSCADLSLVVGDDVCFDAVELDAAANSSAPSRQCTPVKYAYGDVDEFLTPSANRCEVETLSIELLIGIMVGLGVLASMIFMVTSNSGARHAFAHDPLVPVDAELVRRVAVAQRRRAWWVLVVCGGLTAVAPTWEITASLVLGPAIAGFAIVAVGKLHRMRRLLASINAHQPMSYDGSTYAFTPQGQWITIRPGQLERARKAAVPVATQLPR